MADRAFFGCLKVFYINKRSSYKIDSIFSIIYYLLYLVILITTYPQTVT